MGIAVQWDNTEHSVIRWDFENDWSWDDLADTARVSSAMIASADDGVSVILNTTGSRAPSGKITAYHRSAFNYTPENVRALVAVGGQHLEAVQVAPFFNNLHVAENLYHAREMLLQPA